MNTHLEAFKLSVVLTHILSMNAKCMTLVSLIRISKYTFVNTMLVTSFLLVWAHSGLPKNDFLVKSQTSYHNKKAQKHLLLFHHSLICTRHDTQYHYTLHPIPRVHNIVRVSNSSISLAGKLFTSSLQQCDIANLPGSLIIIRTRTAFLSLP